MHGTVTQGAGQRRMGNDEDAVVHKRKKRFADYQLSDLCFKK
jgi:hypothetical protein